MPQSQYRPRRPPAQDTAHELKPLSVETATTAARIDWGSFDGDEMHALGVLARIIGFGDSTRPPVIVRDVLRDERLVDAGRWMLAQRRLPHEGDPHWLLVCRALTETDNSTPSDDRRVLARLSERHKRSSRSGAPRA